MLLPVVEYNHNGGVLQGGVEIQGDPLLSMDDRYLLFLQPI